MIKQYPNSFLHAPLDEELERLGIDNVVLAGFHDPRLHHLDCTRSV